MFLRYQYLCQNKHDGDCIVPRKDVNSSVTARHDAVCLYLKLNSDAFL